jgi:PAS domain S-box-containing protein
MRPTSGALWSDSSRRAARLGVINSLRPRELTGGVAAVLLTTLTAAALVAVFLGDRVTGGTGTVGSLGVLPVIVAAWFLSRRLTLVITLIAILFRVVAWRLGNISGLTCLSQGVVVAGVAVAGSVASSSLTRAALARALASQAAHAQVILDNALDAVISIDENGVTLGWSTRAERLFGWTAAEVVGRPLVHFIVPPAYRQAHTDGLARYRATGEGTVLGSVVSLRAIDRDGREFPVELAISAGVPTDGPDSFIAFVRDISERRRAEEAIEDALAQARTASEAKTEYLSRMSHELRTPLTAIIGFAGLLEMEHPRPSQVPAIDTILKAGDHLLAMIDELLEISRIESGRESLSLEPVRLDDLVDECLGLVALTGDRRGVLVHGDLGDAGRHSVLADRQRLKQVLLNLLSNAIKYNRIDGMVRVTANRVDERMRITVRDTGRGIAPDLLPRLFQPFDRLGAERTEVPGTGLGLALCKRLVDAMAGRIGVDSVAGEGVAFWVELQHAEADEIATERELAGAAAPRSTVPSAERHTVLYVEDNLANVELVERVLEHRPHIRLLPVMQGGLALDLARQQRPDVILLDVHLPDIDGGEVLRRLKEDASTRDIPVIMISADATERQVSRLRDAGARAYLTKPIRVRDLLDTLDEALSRGHATA